MHILRDVHVSNEEDWPRMAKFQAEWSRKFLAVLVPYRIKPEKRWELARALQDFVARAYAVVEKPSFGSLGLPAVVRKAAPDAIEIVGLCTDICVISNAMILKAAFPETPICVDASCCAGVTPESHERALLAMKACQIEVKI